VTGVPDLAAAGPHFRETLGRIPLELPVGSMEIIRQEDPTNPAPKMTTGSGTFLILRGR